MIFVGVAGETRFVSAKTRVSTSIVSINPQSRTSAKGLALNCNMLSNQTTRRIIPAACAAALAMAFAVSMPAHAGKVPTPPVPDDRLNADAGSHAFLVGHAIGTQNYVCAPSATSTSGVAYALFTPEATLFNDDGDQLITHFFSPDLDPRTHDVNTNPAVVADGAIRATWQHSRDGSTVWAKLHNGVSITVDPTAIAWLLLDVAGTQDGLTGGDILSKTTQIQRLNTTGGVAPSQGCNSPSDLGHTAFVDYTADYFFYTNQ
jgi:hypothetical protein